MTFDLAGRRALVTGGGGGLGAAVAEAFLSRGGHVAISDVRPDVVNDVAERLAKRFPDQRVVGIEHDVAGEESTRSAVEAAVDGIGPPDTLVAAAGIGHVKAIEEMSFDEWRSMLAVHLDGTFLAIRHTLPGMLESRFGRIIGFSSIASAQGVELQAHYAAAKAGIEGLVRSLAREAAPRGVTVNAIAPGYFDTTLNELASPERLEALLASVPAGRFGRPEEIGALAVYLASEEAGYLTGEVISSDGGFTYCNHLVAS